MKKIFRTALLALLVMICVVGTAPSASAINFDRFLDEANAALDGINKILDVSFGSGKNQTPTTTPTTVPVTEAATSSSGNSLLGGVFGGLETSWEKTMGEQTHQALSKDPGFSKDARYLNRLGTVARRLVPVVERKELSYRFAVLNTDEVNAFAAPGGYIYVTRGLMNSVGSDDELAGVVAHELGHVNKKHSIKQAEKAGLMAVVVALMGTKDEAKKYQSAAALAAYFATLKFSRTDEYEADRCAVQYSAKAGYNPAGIISFFNRINKDNGLTKVTKYFSTHPPTTDRINKVKEEISKVTGKPAGDSSSSSPSGTSTTGTVSSSPAPTQTQPTSTGTSTRPTVAQLQAAYEVYLFKKSRYEYVVSQNAPIDQVMTALKEYQAARDKYMAMRKAAGY